jgi:serine protease AprX
LANTNDNQGHGTAVADVAAGGGGWQGVAPDLDPKTGGGGTLYNLKVAFKRNGSGGPGECTLDPPKIIESDLFDALEAILHADGSVLPRYTDLIVNLSANLDETPLNPPVAGYDDTARRFDRLVDNNSPHVTVVVSAGNTGWSNNQSVPNSVKTPATAYNVIAVAAQGVESESQKPSFEILDKSSQGPTKDDRSKPDIAAPGTNITVARFDWGAAGIPLYKHDAWGTSVAAPHVAGAAALFGEAIGTSNAMALKALLLNEANRPANTLVENFPKNGLWNSKRGWGLLDLKNFPALLGRWRAISQFVNKVSKTIKLSASSIRSLRKRTYATTKVPLRPPAISLRLWFGIGTFTVRLPVRSL